MKEISGKEFQSEMKAASNNFIADAGNSPATIVACNVV
jgi:hypothetical protein